MVVTGYNMNVPKINGKAEIMILNQQGHEHGEKWTGL